MLSSLHAVLIPAFVLAALVMPAAAQTTHVVDQIGFSFQPANLVIDEGDTVRWIWTGGEHTVTEGLGPLPVNEAFDGVLSTFNPTYEVLFDAVMLATNPRIDNVYPYYCIPHIGAGMTGVITVRERWGTYLDGSQVVPPVGTSASGDGALSLDLVANQLSWDISFSGLTGPATAAHLHGPAAAGQTAPVLLTLGTTSPLVGSAVLTSQQVADLRAGLSYMDIHTATWPDGEVRGQLLKGSWSDVGGASFSVYGIPELRGIGPVTGQSVLALDLRRARPNKLMLLWISLSSSPQNLLGGTLHAFPFTDQVLLASSPTGTFQGGAPIPVLPAGTDVWFQFLIDDDSNIYGITLSNAMKATAP